ncbi:TPA: hypothetical protein ACFNMI_000879 [Neisseria bacilliformis]
MNTLNEQIIFQMGLNLKKYQEIEQTLKNLISSSGQTISTSIRSDQDKLDMEAKSNYPGVWQGTLGGFGTNSEFFGQSMRHIRAYFRYGLLKYDLPNPAYCFDQGSAAI